MQCKQSRLIKEKKADNQIEIRIYKDGVIKPPASKFRAKYVSILIKKKWMQDADGVDLH